MIRLDAEAVEILAAAVAERVAEKLRARVGGGEAYAPLEQLAERFGVQPATLRAWARTGRLKALRAGRRWRATASAVEAAMGKCASSPATPAAPRASAESFLRPVAGGRR